MAGRKGSEFDLRWTHEPSDVLRRGADGRDADVTLGEPKAKRVNHRLDGGLDGVDVVRGLAHAHEDHVSDGRHRVLAYARLRRVQLREDLVHTERAQQAHRAGGAKGAALPAADLRADAQCREVAVRDDDGLHFVTAGQRNQELPRAATTTRCSGAACAPAA